MSYPHFNGRGRFSIISKQSASIGVQMLFDTENTAGWLWGVFIEKISSQSPAEGIMLPLSTSMPASETEYNGTNTITGIYNLDETLLESLEVDQSYKLTAYVGQDPEGLFGEVVLYVRTRPLQEPSLSVVSTNFEALEFDVSYDAPSSQIYENSYMRVKVFEEDNTLILNDEFNAFEVSPKGIKNYVIDTLTPSHDYRVEVTNILKRLGSGNPYTFVITNDKIYSNGILVDDEHGFATNKHEVGLGDYKYKVEYETDYGSPGGQLKIQLNAFDNSNDFLGVVQFLTTTVLGEYEFDLSTQEWKEDIKYLAFSIFWEEAGYLVPITLTKFNLKDDNTGITDEQTQKRIPDYIVSTMTPTIIYMDDEFLNNTNPTTYTTVPVAITASGVNSYYVDDWEFDGWYDNPEYTGIVVTSITDFGNYTLYAKMNDISIGDATVPLVQLVSRLTTEMTLSFEPGTPIEGTYLGYGVQFDIGDDNDDTDNALLFPDIDALEHIEIVSPVIDEENVMIFDEELEYRSYRFTGLDDDTTYKVKARTVFFGTDISYSSWQIYEFDTLDINPSVHKPPIVNLVSVTTDTLVLEFDFNNDILAGSKIVVTGSNLVISPFDINFSERKIETLTFDNLTPNTEYQIICSSARNVSIPLMSEVVIYNFKTLEEDLVVADNYKILIGGDDYTNKISHGFSWHEKITYDLNMGSITIPFSDNNMAFPMFTIVDILKDDGTYLFSGRIAHDFVKLTAKKTGVQGKEQLYRHEISLIEHTKLLERYWISGKTFTQPTGRAKITYNSYTLLDVVEILRDTVPTRLLIELLDGQEPRDYDKVKDLTVADDVNVFRLKPNVMETLREIEAPEFNFKEINLREALNEVFSVIDAVPYLTRDRFLEFRYFNTVGNKILDMRNTKEDREQDITEYATTLVSNAVNTIANDRQQQNSLHGNESYPEQGLFTALRSRDFIFNFDSSYIPTPKPIYDIKRVIARTNFVIRRSVTATGDDLKEVTSNFTIDITDRVVEKNTYDLLDQADLKPKLGRLRKNSVFTYTYGQPNIDTSHTFGIFNTSTALQNVMKLGFINSYRGETIGSGANEFTIPSNMNRDGFKSGGYIYRVLIKSIVLEETDEGYFDYAFRTEYLSLPDEIRMEIDREDTSEIGIYSELITNQKARLIDSTRYMNNMYFNINKKGLSNLELSHQVATIDGTFNLGDEYDEGFIVTEKETVFYNGHIRALYKLNKDFNKTALFQGLNSQVRQWEIGEKGRTLTREIAYKESIRIRTTELDGSSVGQVGGIKTLLPAFVWGNIRDTFNNYEGLPNSVTHCLIRTFLGDPATGQAVSEWLGAYSKIAMSPQRNVGGNTVSLSFQFDDNVSAGKTIDASRFIGLSQFANKVIKYTDENGRFDTMYFEFFTGSATVANDDTDSTLLYPLVTQQMFNSATLAGEDSLYVKKDNREVLKFNFLYQFVAPEKDLIIGQEFIERNYIFSKIGLSTIGTVGVNATKFKIRFYYGHEFRKTENGKAPQSTDEQLLDCTWVDGKNRLEINNTATHSDSTSWAIVSDDDIILAYNGDTNRSILFDLLGKRRDIQYRRY